MTRETGSTDRRAFLSHCAAGMAAMSLSSPAGLACEDNKGNAPVEDPGAGNTTSHDAWADLRARFLLDPDLAYFNTGGLGPSPRVVLETLNRETLALEEVSECGHDQVAGVRRRACALMHCDDDELAITHNTTKKMNIIARGVPLRAGDEVLLTTHEHPGGAMPWLALARDKGVIVRTFEPGTGGDDTLQRVRMGLTPRTRVVSVSHITCTTGTVLPVRRIAALCRSQGVFSVIDGAQAVGMIPVDLHDLGCDFYAASGHKWLLGPKGTGLLYVRRAMLEVWRATHVGAYSNEAYDLDRGIFETVVAARAVEYGTRNTALTLALGAAIDFARSLGIERIAQHGRALSAHLARRLDDVGEVTLLTPKDAESSASIVTFRVRRPGFDPWKWADTLKNVHRIRVRPVGEHGLGALRVCMHTFNGLEDVDRLVTALGKMISP